MEVQDVNQSDLIDPILNNPTFSMVIFFVYFAAKTTLDPQFENWDVFSNYDFHSGSGFEPQRCSGFELYIVGMKVHYE